MQSPLLIPTLALSKSGYGSESQTPSQPALHPLPTSSPCYTIVTFIIHTLIKIANQIPSPYIPVNRCFSVRSIRRTSAWHRRGSPPERSSFLPYHHLMICRRLPFVEWPIHSIEICLICFICHDNICPYPSRCSARTIHIPMANGPADEIHQLTTPEIYAKLGKNK